MSLPPSSFPHSTCPGAPIPRRLRMRLTAPLVLVGCLALAGGATAQLATAPWPMVGHDVRHTSQSELVGPQTGLVLWRTQTSGFVKSSPVIGPDGRVYIGVKKGFCAVNPVDGAPIWCNKLSGVVRRNAAAIAADGTLYIGDRANRLWAISADGTTKWSFAVGNDGDVNTSPAIGADGTIYMAGTFNGVVHALDPDGNLLWRLPLGSAVSYSSPAIGADGTIYIGTVRGQLVAISPAGVLQWTALLRSSIRFGSPSIGADGTIYIGSKAGISAVSPAGDILWQVEAPGYVATAPAIATDGTLYVAGHEGLFALAPDGSILWSLQTGERFRSSPAIGADGTIYTTAGNRVVALRPDGSELWQFGLRRVVLSAPAIGPGGVLYVAADGFYSFAD
jgi:outer membrane protein assembly factor BamB